MRNNNKQIKVYITILITLIFNSKIFGSSTDLLKFTPDVIYTSLANISTSLNDNNIWAIYNNQASLARAVNMTVGISYKRIMNTFNLFNLAYGLPMRTGYAGVSFSYLDYGEGDFVSGVDLLTGRPVVSDTFRAYDFLANAGYANELSSINLLYGSAIRILQNTIAGQGATYVAMDINSVKEFNNNVIVGLNLRNIGIGANDDTDVPFYTALGVTFPLPFVEIRDGSLYLLSEVRYYPLKYLSEIWDGSVAFKYLYKGFQFNLGFFLSERNKYIFNIGSVGISYFMKENNIKFDYAITTQDMGVGFNHTFAFAYYFKKKVKGVRRTYRLEVEGHEKVEMEKKKIKEEEEKLFKEIQKEIEKFDKEEMQEEWSDE